MINPPSNKLHSSTFHDTQFEYVLLKHWGHQDFTKDLQTYLDQGYDILWETFRLTPEKESYVVILRKKLDPLTADLCSINRMGI